MNHLLTGQLIKFTIGAVLALVLFGVVAAREAALVLGLFVTVQCCRLVAECRRKLLTDEHWQSLMERLRRGYEDADNDERDAVAAHVGLPPGSSPREVAQAEVRGLRQQYVPPRDRTELVVEFLGLAAFAVLVPVGLALWCNDFVSFRIPIGWMGAAATVLSVGLYLLPRAVAKGSGHRLARILWWGTPFVPALIACGAALETKHDYLNPLHPERERLAAERVLQLRSIIVAGRHADWVARYARQLDEQGNSEAALHFYREALRLNAGDDSVRLRIAALTGKNEFVFRQGADIASATNRSGSALWTSTSVRRQKLDSSVGELNECTVAIVPVGNVPATLLDAIAHAIQRELSLPAFVTSEPLALPKHTRTRGLVTGKQWHHTSLLETYRAAYPSLPMAPVKILLVTDVDIYDDGANYMFSVSYEHWGALMSVARLGNVGQEPDRVMERAGKQSLSAIIKTFRIPPSINRACVTSYARSLEELDAKGSRPAPETALALQREVAQWNRGWRQQKGRMGSNSIQRAAVGVRRDQEQAEEGSGANAPKL